MRLSTASLMSRRCRQRAVTLLELMVAMSVLTFIILGLYSMFNRTQQAFLDSMTQVEVHEPARAVMDMLTRDLEQMKASDLVDRTNLYISPIYYNGQPISQFVQTASDGRTLFTNAADEFFFLTKTSYWSGIAYFLRVPSTNAGDVMLYTNMGIGSLMRFQTNVSDYYHSSVNLLDTYLTNTTIDAQLVTDGVMHLELRAYDKNGNYVDTSGYSFTNTDLPAYLELEFAVLEPKTLLQARSILNAAAQRQFLQETTNRASAVHLFRQRIEVRSVN